MNFRMIANLLGKVLLALSGLLLLPAAAGLCFGETVWHFLVSAVLSALLGLLLLKIRVENGRIFARDGFVTVSLAWILMSLLGALPFVLSGDIPNYIDAFFETVSGFTTTGATVLKNVEALSRGCAFWRIFTHWIGGMGILVFIMAVLPMSGEHSMHIMRAEVPGPTAGKLVPRAKKSAIILYVIYIALTLLETGLLMCGGMSFYEALLHAFSTAGTGGFSTRNAGIAAFDSLYIEIVVAVFMLIFSVNFNVYFLIICRKLKKAFANEELHWFAGAVILCIAAITFFVKDF